MYDVTPIHYTACGCGGIGRRTRFRFWRETVGVQVPSSADRKTLVNIMFTRVFNLVFPKPMNVAIFIGSYKSFPICKFNSLIFS